MAFRSRAVSATPVRTGPIDPRKSVGVLLDVPGGRVIGLAVAIEICLAALVVLGIPGGTEFWLSVQWIAAGLCGTIAAAQGVHAAAGRTRRVRLFMTSGVVLISIGQSICFVEVVGIGAPPVMLAIIPFGLALAAAGTVVVSIRGQVRSVDELTAYLDVGAAFCATTAIVMVVIPADLERLGGWAVIAAIALPSIFLGTSVAGAVGALTSRIGFSTTAVTAMLLGVFFLGLGYLTWPWSGALPAGGLQVSGEAMTAGLLLVAYGAASWSDRASTTPAHAMTGGRLRNALPLIATIVAAAVLLFAGRRVTGIADMLLDASIVATMVLLVLRQTALIQDRGRIISEAEDAHRARVESIERVQGQLIAASKRTAVGELAAAVAHEVNNPLASILLSAELLLETEGPDDPQRADLEVIRDEVLRARRIIWALLDFARPHAPERLPSDLNAVVRGTVNLLRYHLERVGVRIVERYEPLPAVNLDPNAIQQALLNLLNNAAGAVGDGGELAIATSYDGRSAIVTVRDDGPGMDDEVVAQALLPFFTTHSDQGATGLGLPVAVGLVEGHGGTIDLTSRPGQGTVVRITLPLDSTPGPSADPARDGSIAPPKVAAAGDGDAGRALHPRRRGLAAGDAR